MRTMLREALIQSGDGPRVRLEGCSRLLHLLTCREKMFMVMASSGNQLEAKTGSPVLAVAGLLASQYAWKDLDARLQALNGDDTEPGSYLNILESGAIAGIGAAARLAQPSRQSYSPGPTRGHDPGLVCFEHCVLEASRRMQVAPRGQTVCFVMDWHDPLASSALWHLEELMSFAPLPVRERLGAIGFEDGDAFPPLRAARRLARQCCEIRDQSAAPRSSLGLDCFLY